MSEVPLYMQLHESLPDRKRQRREASGQHVARDECIGLYSNRFIDSRLVLLVCSLQYSECLVFGVSVRHAALRFRVWRARMYRGSSLIRKRLLLGP